MLRVAGFAGAVIGAYDSEQDDAAPSSASITGINADGSATGSVASASTSAEPARITIGGQEDKWWLPVDFQWPVADIKLNRTAIVSKAAGLATGGLSREVAWARVTSQALRQGLRQAALAKLKADFDQTLLTDHPVNVGHVFNVAVMALQPTPFYAALTTAWYAVSPLVSVRYNIRNTGSSHLQDKRWSLLPCGSQPDRIALAALMTYAMPGIRVRQ